MDEDKILIGTFSVDESVNCLFLEDKIGSFKDYNIYVYKNDSGCIPHFHVISNDEKFHTCVKIEKPEYFLHGSKTDKFKSKARKELVKFLESEDNWERIISEWNSNKNRKQLSKDLKCPNYNKLK